MATNIINTQDRALQCLPRGPDKVVVYSLENVLQSTLPTDNQQTPTRGFPISLSISNAMIINPKPSDKRRKDLRQRARTAGDDMYVWLNKPPKNVMREEALSTVLVMQQVDGSPLLCHQLAVLPLEMRYMFFFPSPVNLVSSCAAMGVYFVQKVALRTITSLPPTSPGKTEDILCGASEGSVRVVHYDNKPAFSGMRLVSHIFVGEDTPGTTNWERHVMDPVGLSIFVGNVNACGQSHVPSIRVAV